MGGSGGSTNGLVGGGAGGAGDEQSEKLDAFTFISSSSGKILFRQGHLGDYTGTETWGAPPSGEEAIGLYLTSAALEAFGAKKNTLEIGYSLNCAYLLPYYVIPETVSAGKVGTVVSIGDGYKLGYYAYEYTVSGYVPTLPEELRAIEEQYREYVYDNYTDLPSNTRRDILNIFNEAIAKAGKNPSEMSRFELVKWVESYIRGAAKYNMQFEAYPPGSDMAIYFLTSEANEGVCRQFASAALVMLRALGIPARYVVGYSAQGVTAGVPYTVDTSMAHAWVEVYIDGLGWINIDPTGAASNDGEEEEPEAPVATEKLVFKSMMLSKEFDGKPLTGAIAMLKEGVLAKGHTPKFSFSGTQTEIGESENTFTVEIFDENGVNVTSSYTVECMPGMLKVEKRRVTVASKDADKLFDGSPLICHECVTVNGTLLEGHTLVTEFSGTQTELGASDNIFSVVDVIDAAGNSVKDYYDITETYGELSVHLAKISLMPEKQKRSYTGRVHTCDGIGVWVVDGAESLPAGYKIAATVKGQLTNPGKTKTEITAVEIYDAQGNRITDNYDIETVCGELEVMSIRITITSASASKEYDGTELTAPECWISFGALAEGHTLDAKGVGSTHLPEEAGGDPVNTIEYTIYDAQGNDITNSEFYSVTLDPGELIIT